MQQRRADDVQLSRQVDIICHKNARFKPRDVRVEVLERFVPCIERVPKHAEKDKGRVGRFAEDRLPVDAFSREAYPRLQEAGCGGTPFWVGVIRDDGTAVSATDHMESEEVVQEDTVIYGVRLLVSDVVRKSLR